MVKTNPTVLFHSRNELCSSNEKVSGFSEKLSLWHLGMMGGGRIQCNQGQPKAYFIHRAVHKLEGESQHKVGQRSSIESQRKVDEHATKYTQAGIGSDDVGTATRGPQKCMCNCDKIHVGGNSNTKRNVAVVFCNIPFQNIRTRAHDTFKPFTIQFDATERTLCNHCCCSRAIKQQSYLA